MEAPAAALAKETEDDFFDSWSKPSTPKSSNPGTPRISTPPIIGRSVSAIPTSINTNSASPVNVTPAPPSPRTLTSSAAARPGRLGATSRLNSASSGGSTTSSAPKKSKLGLGAAKTKPVDFAEAERKAIEEAERIKKLGYDREQEEKEEKARKEIESLKRAQELGSRAGIATATTTAQATTNGGYKSTTDPQKSASFPRLGFGAIPGAGAAAAVAAAPTTSKTRYASFFFFLIFYALTFRLFCSFSSIADDSPTTARDKFGNQKGISSDMYFGRNSYDPDAVREAQTRLQSFQGATAISSNQYFGREEEEERLGGHEGSLLGDGSSLAGLEHAARDAVTRVLSNPDVQNVGETIRTGALRVCERFLLFCGLFDFNLVNSFLITWLRCPNVHNDYFFFGGPFVIFVFSLSSIPSLSGYIDCRGNICPINNLFFFIVVGWF